MNGEFIEAVRAADWNQVRAQIQRGQVPSRIETPSSSIYTWLVELDAPGSLILDLLRLRHEVDPPDTFEGALLETCLAESKKKANAFVTFSLLLESGIGPNVIVNGGCTLFQIAMERNRVREVQEMLRHGV